VGLKEKGVGCREKGNHSPFDKSGSGELKKRIDRRAQAVTEVLINLSQLS
jgi:hypothetical protein